jgi:hypothetical protein
MKRDKEYLYNAFNATSTDDGKGGIESYENWLERQLINRMEHIDELEQANGAKQLHLKALPMCGVVQQSELLIGLLTMLEKEGGNEFIDKAEIVAKYQANL